MKSSWITIGTLLFCLTTDSIGACRVYDLVEVAVMDCRARSGIEIFDKDAHSAMDNLLGAVPYGDDGLAVYDRISRTLMVFDSQTNMVWQRGSVGQGPEDHVGPCEPLLLQDGYIGLADYGGQPKVLIWDDSGDFVDSVVLTGYLQCQQIEYASGGYVALCSRTERAGDGYQVIIDLVRYDSNGFKQAEQEIRRFKMVRPRAGERVPADIWRPFPRMCVDSSGFVYIQRDTRRARFDVYNEELTLVNAIGRDWTGEARSPEDIQSDLDRWEGKIEPFTLELAGVHVFARDDGELWVQLPGRTPDEVMFEVLDRTSTGEGQVRIAGMPSATGEFMIEGDRLLWFEDPDLITDRAECVGLYATVPRP